MKKFSILLMMVAVAIMSFTLVSCKDEEVANKLDGSWSGTTGLGYEEDGRYYQAQYTIIEFDQDALMSKSGTGFWVDVYGEDAPFEWFASEMTWDVHDDGKTIYIYTKQAGVGTYTITDFTVSEHHFRGSIYINSETPSSFDMQKSYEKLDEYKNYQGWHR